MNYINNEINLVKLLNIKSMVCTHYEGGIKRF